MLNNALRREPEIERVPIRNFLPFFSFFRIFRSSRQRPTIDRPTIIVLLSKRFRREIEVAGTRKR